MRGGATHLSGSAATSRSGSDVGSSSGVGRVATLCAAMRAASNIGIKAPRANLPSCDQCPRLFCEEAPRHLGPSERAAPPGGFTRMNPDNAALSGDVLINKAAVCGQWKSSSWVAAPIATGTNTAPMMTPMSKHPTIIAVMLTVRPPSQSHGPSPPASTAVQSGRARARSQQPCCPRLGHRF
jgi:hypothetical protein